MHALGHAPPDRSRSRRALEHDAKQPLGIPPMPGLSARLRLRRPVAGEGSPGAPMGSGHAISLLRETFNLTRPVCQMLAGTAASCMAGSSTLLQPASSCCNGEGAASSGAARSWFCRAHSNRVTSAIV